MNVPSLQCTLPFCGCTAEQSDCSFYSRNTSVAIGVILLVIGLLILSGACGSSIDIVGGWACLSIGFLTFAIGACLRCATTKTHNDEDDAPVSQELREEGTRILRESDAIVEKVEEEQQHPKKLWQEFKESEKDRNREIKMALNAQNQLKEEREKFISQCSELHQNILNALGEIPHLISPSKEEIENIHTKLEKYDETLKELQNKNKNIETISTSSILNNSSKFLEAAKSKLLETRVV